MTEARPDPRRIVVGVDGSPESKLALRWAARIAASEDAVIEVVAAWEFPPASGWAALPEGYSPKLEMDKIVTEAVDEVFGAQRPVGMTVRSVQGHPAAVLLKISRDAVMLVVGSRGHGGFLGLLLGSVSTKVAEHATCPVLVVHENPDHAELREATS
jgi:nucleotide-binding universal stress UspA family protein